MSNKFLKIHPNDNVLVALADLPTGEQIANNGHSFLLSDAVPAKHKFANQPLNPGDPVFMYGVLVGKALSAIPAGGVLTTKNIRHDASHFSGKTHTHTWEPLDVSRWREKTFMGYHRPDGQVGTANYWIVVPLVFCENRNVDTIRHAFTEELGFDRPNEYKKYVKRLAELYRTGKVEEIELTAMPAETQSPESARLFRNIDGIKFLNHEGGCGGTRQDAEALCALIAGYIHNPNVAGATILSLGCQNAQADLLMEKVRNLDPGALKPVIVLEQQKEGTERELLANAIRKTFAALVIADRCERNPAPLSKLVVGLECGGSDGFSGISANPAIGHTS
ncbi:MAG TPA: UxaA family hydrolase, partial [Chryseosolibacter sp.]|nr:UxaA family hydrolase [Chryseosolibacter sp.]